MTGSTANLPPLPPHVEAERARSRDRRRREQERRARELESWHRDLKARIEGEVWRKRLEELARLRALARRAEERDKNAVLDMRMETYRMKKGTHAIWAALGRADAEPPKLEMDLAWARARRAQEYLPTDPLVEAYRAHVHGLCRMHRFTALFVVLHHGSGYAMRDGRTVELPPINSPWSYATALHELGHLLNRCTDLHVRVASTVDKNTTYCVRCELSAWQWATAAARPAWTKAMHDNMREALATYRPYGTAAERQEIDRVSSETHLRRLRLEVRR